MKIFWVSSFVFLLNLPFGYWRARTTRFSRQWIIAIHLPVPFVAAGRLLSGLGFELYTFPILIGAYFAGQFLGAWLSALVQNTQRVPVTACIFVDLYRLTVNSQQKNF